MSSEPRRTRWAAVAASGIIAAQGLAVLAGGAVADLTDPATAVAVSGGLGSSPAVGGALAWRSAPSGELPDRDQRSLLTQRDY